MTDFQTLEFTVKDRVACITLSRPKAANGINLEMAAELAEAAKRCDHAADIRVVIITGSGSFFSAGGDIKAMASFGDDVARNIKTLADDLHLAISTFARMDAPVIAAVNGMAAGAGFSLAVSADIVIAGLDAKFMMAYTKAGLSPDGSSSYTLPRLIGLRATQELMLLNPLLSAQEAYERGLVTQLTKDADPMIRAREIAAQLAAGSRGANAAVKRLLLATFSNSLETQMEMEGRAISQCAGSEDGREGVAAFIEKRRPIFK